jgi:lysophospholipase L1-like esterase
MRLRSWSRFPSAPMGTATGYRQSYTLVGVGDSLTAGQDPDGPDSLPYLQQLSNWTDWRPYWNAGVAGETSTQIKTRFLADPTLHVQTAILWPGRGNDWTSGTTSATVFADIDAMIAAMAAAGNDRYIVLGITTGGGAEKPGGGGSGETRYNNIIAHNIAAAARYGDRFFDIRTWLVNDGLEATGRTPTADDLIDRANDQIPRQLRRDADNVHMNNAGYDAVAYKVAELLGELISGLPYDGLVTEAGFAQVIGAGTTSWSEKVRSFTNAIAFNDPIKGYDVMTGSNRQYWFLAGGGHARPEAAGSIDRYITGIGYGALGYDCTGSGNTAVGYNAGLSLTTGPFNTIVGIRAGDALTTGGSNIAIGVDALTDMVDGSENIAIGRNALRASTAANPSVAIGYQSMLNNTTGALNVAVGSQSLRSNTTGTNNVAVGDSALYANTEGGGNVAIGKFAGDAITTGSDNVAVGRGAYSAGQTSGGNVAVGVVAMGSATGNTDCVAIGNGAGENLSGADYVVAIGAGALPAAATGNGSIAIGYHAGTLSTGQYNTLIGFQAADNLTTGNYNIFIGHNIDANSVAGSNFMSIGNLIFGESVDGEGTTISSGTVGIGVRPTAAGPRLQVAGSIYSDTGFYGTEVTAPSAPAANGFRLFAQDNGAGKTQLMVLFATGAAQEIAIQP